MRDLSIEQLIFNLDNDKEILNFKLKNGFLLWPQIRYSIYRNLINVKIKQSISKKPIKSNLLETLKNLSILFLGYLSFLTLFKKKYDLIVFNSNFSVFLDSEKKYRSRINDFIFEIPELNCLNVFSNTLSLNKRFVKPYIYREVIHFKYTVLNKIKRKSKNEDFEIGYSFIKYLSLKLSNYNYVGFWESIEFDLIEFINSFHVLHKSYYSFLKHTEPKLLIIEGANYGGAENALLVWIANSLGIKTIEVQHGVFDLAYQYGDNLIKSKEFAKYKTDFLFTMGNFWKDYCRIPSRVYPFGYPYLEKKMKSFNCTNEFILIISQGSMTKNLKDIALQLALKSNFKIIFRIHPNESDGEYLILKKAGITISKSGDVYKLVSQSIAVIGSYSTLLFEAILFNKQIFIHRNELSIKYVPEFLGTWFEFSDEIIKSLDSGSSFTENKEKFWSLNWENSLNTINQFENLW
jgi:hypothetical protein